MSKRKTSLKIVREENGDCLINVTFSDKDKERHNDDLVLQELIKDASTADFFDLIPKKE